jgi:hypothetical protein
MGDSIRTLLRASGVLQHVVLTSEVDALLGALEVDGAVTTAAAAGAEIRTGAVRVVSDLSKSPIPGFDFAVTAPDPGVRVPFKLRLEPAGGPTSFKFWLQLADESHALLAFSFVKAVPGFALTGATKTVAADGTVRLEPNGTKPTLVSRSPEPGAALGPALLVFGSANETASIRFTPDTDSNDGIITLGLEPPTVVFGSSSVGFELPAVVIDDSESAKGPGDGAPGLEPPLASIPADTPTWRGILARELDFYLPADVPLFGGAPIKGYLAISRGEGGAELVIDSSVPARPAAAGVGGRPGFKVRIECLDPTASGLGGLVPTLIQASMELPLDGAAAGFKDDAGASHSIAFAAGKPVRVTASLARDPLNDPGAFKVVLGVAAQGPDGIVSVSATEMGGAKIFNVAAAMATALIADKDVDREAEVGDTQGVVVASLLAAGTALSSLFTNPSKFVLHGAEIESSGHGAPVGGALVVRLDYSVAALVTSIDVGVLAVSMNPNQPMRIRVRDARLALDFTKSGLDMVGLDFERSTMEIESPGAWNVSGLDSLFDVLGSRSGRGSSWFEVDLGFKLNLGPVKVSGATIRATLLPSGEVEASIRGLQAGVDIPGAIVATGGLRLLHPDGFAADLSARIVPLNLTADAGIVYRPPMVLLRLDVDLPAPIPLANTGFGLLGLGGLVAFSGRPDYSSVPEPDPIAQQLRWDPKKPESFKEARGQSTFGFGAAVGTLPDMGFMFSAKAGILITVPDVAVRGSLNGRILQPAVKMSDPSWPAPMGLSFLGFVAVDSSALSFGLLGLVDLKPLLEVRVPLAGRFPFEGNTSDWYVYLGADGGPGDRSVGPISAKVLPDILGIEADAYVMVRGHGLVDWPHGRRMLDISDGFVVAFGFSVHSQFGIRPIVWAELYFSLDLLLATRPPTIAGFGRAGGSLNLGPFSLGVEAKVMFKVTEDQQYFWAEVTGRIELFFFDVEGTVTISFGDKDLTPKLPPPDRHPLDRVDQGGVRVGSLATLTDDRYRVLAELAEDPAQAKAVWPDVMVSLAFAVAPDINPATAGSQFPAVVGPGATPAPRRLGSEMLHYSWRLERVELHDVTDEPDKMNGPGTVPAGRLAARWQVPRSGTGGSDISELVLFSTGPDLWVNRLADGGGKLPGGDPLKAAADICNIGIPDPGAAWTLGLSAEPASPGLRLPPEFVSANPRVSRVGAHLTHYGLFPALAAVGPGIGELQLDTVHALGEPYSLEPSRLVAWAGPEEVERAFDGHLVVPNLRWLPGEDIGELEQASGLLAQAIHLDLDQPIVDGRLVLIANPELVSREGRDFMNRIHVLDDSGNHWPLVDARSVPTGETACVFHAPSGDPVGRLGVTYPLDEPVGVVGLGGVTVTARDAVVTERALIVQEIAGRATAAAAGPPTTPPVDAPHQRAILDPGRLYRIDVDMTWAGEVATQDEAGQVQVDAGKSVTFGGPGSDTYATGLSTNRRLFFKTARKVPESPPKEGLESLMVWLLTKRDIFRPEMLARYLAGYEPAQSEESRFCDDPLRAHFLADHVAALAKAYGFELEVAVRRVDRAGDEHAEPSFLIPSWAFATNPAFLTAVDQIRYGYALASGCDTPTPGSTASVTAALEPLAWYEVFLHARSAEAGFAHGQLDGVTFRTSRWRSPADMLAGLGFASAGHDARNVVTGDLAVKIPGAGLEVGVDDDGAFIGALESLGLPGWPLADGPRVSRLWTDGGNGAWLLAGLLIESPEPVHRPGRVEITAVTATDAAGNEASLNLARRDRSGSRLLFVAHGPVTLPGAGSVVSIQANGILDGSTTPIMATRQIAGTPAFAGEP